AGMSHRLLDLVIGMRDIHREVAMPARAQGPDRVGGGVDVLECSQHAGHRLPPGDGEAHQCPPAARRRGIGIISLISWIATIGKVRAKSRKYMPNQPKEPARMPQSAQVGLMKSQAQGT